MKELRLAEFGSKVECVISKTIRISGQQFMQCAVYMKDLTNTDILERRMKSLLRAVRVGQEVLKLWRGTLYDDSGVSCICL